MTKAQIKKLKTTLLLQKQIKAVEKEYKRLDRRFVDSYDVAEENILLRQMAVLEKLLDFVDDKTKTMSTTYDYGW